jgi:hypothetical protein
MRVVSCGRSGSTYVSSPSTHTFLKVPAGWRVFGCRQSEIRTRTSAVASPAFPFLAVIDADPKSHLRRIRICAQAMTSSAGAIPDKFRTDLRSDERIIAFAWALLPRKHTRYVTFAPIGTIVDAVDLIRSRFDLRAIRDRSVAFGFPLDRRMALAVTDDRLIIWSASPRRIRTPVHRGDVARGQIRTARLPYIGGGWRVVEIGLVDGRGVRSSSTDTTPTTLSGPCRGPTHPRSQRRPHWSPGMIRTACIGATSAPSSRPPGSDHPVAPRRGDVIRSTRLPSATATGRGCA